MRFVVVDRRNGQAVFSSANFAEANAVAQQDPNYFVQQQFEPGEIRA